MNEDAHLEMVYEDRHAPEMEPNDVDWEYLHGGYEDYEPSPYNGDYSEC